MLLSYYYHAPAEIASSLRSKDKRRSFQFLVRSLYFLVLIIHFTFSRPFIFSFLERMMLLE
jgi:hypothetical protein